MAGSITLTIFVNVEEKRIYLSSGNESKTNSYVAANYSSTNIDDKFFEEFSNILSIYKQKYPKVSLSGISLVLSDYLFFTDMLTIPNMGKKAVANSLSLVIDTLYKNKDELQYNTYPLSQTKQNAVYGMVGVRKELLAKFHDVCDKVGGTVRNVTFAANAVANGVMSLNPKVRGAICLLLDIKENGARFAFLNKGRTLGAYYLPFGYGILHNNQLTGEDMLFDNSSAELLLLNAKEKARAKQLTVISNDVEQTSDAHNVFSDSFGSEADGEDEVEEVRGGRKLPKYMLRDIPDSEAGFIYENFRIFVKWTLELIASNSQITSLGDIETVYVNMPKEYAFLFDMANEELAENGTVFAPVVAGATALKTLEMLGGFNVGQYNGINNF